MNLDWTYDEFSAFAMFYAASIDGEVDPEEEALIKQRLDADCYLKIKAEFEKCSDAQVINTIMDYQPKYMSDEAGVNRLLGDLKGIFEADHRYTAVEREIMRLFKRLL
ncbi:MAG: TerB family tellurite resistance protein [Mameliella sp.]|nr:TerB family tellurite resistance protein [Phaeodactylibacter sp.]NRA50437.1 TerB family tellurite resistance protein [Phaeodactylibacter sp.]